MYKNLEKCLECDYTFKSGPDKIKHLKNHKLSFEEYIIKHYYGGCYPTCKCGCGTILSFKAFKDGPFFSEYTKNHFSRKKHTEEAKLKIKINSKKAIKAKYGVDNLMELPEMIKKIAKTKLKKYGDSKYNNYDKGKQSFINQFFNKIIDGDRLPGNITPMFTVNDYRGVLEEYEFMCHNCNNSFKSHLDNGRIPRCFICKPYSKSSEGEKELIYFIRGLLPGEEVISNNRKIFSGKYELDTYIPGRNIAFEYNGNYWHSDKGKKPANYHRLKTEACEDLGIHLIQIFEDEWIYKQEIIKNKIRGILKLDTGYIGARKCKIKEINFQEKKDFLDKYHIQGNDVSQIYLGAYNMDILIAVMTLSNPRKALGSVSNSVTEYELVRFASSFRIPGVVSKMLDYFFDNYNVTEVISYADRRWTNKNNNIYLKSGFELVGISKPNYWYILNKENYLTRHHRFGFRKSELSKKLKIFDPKLSESKNMEKNGYCKLYDAGNLKFRYKKTPKK